MSDFSSDVTKLKDDIERLEELTDDEATEVIVDIEKLPKEELSGGVAQLKSDCQRLLHINKQLTDFLNHLNDESYIEAREEFEELVKERDRVAEGVFTELEGTDISHLGELEKLEGILEKLESGVKSDIRRLAVDEAEARISSRYSVLVEEDPLQRFVNQVRELQIGQGEETAGVFHYSEVNQGILLDKYVPLENKLREETNIGSTSGMFYPGDDEQRMLERSDGNLVFAHSHPAESPSLSQVDIKSHSGMDASSSTVRGISTGLLAAPGLEEDWIWLVPQEQSGEGWENHRLGVVRNGDVLGADELREEYPQVVAYNRSIVYALAYGPNYRSEEDWLEFYREHVK